MATFGLGTAAPVSALPAPPSCGAPVLSGTFHTVTCNYTGGEQSFVVPAGVTSLDVVATSGSSPDLGLSINGIRAEATVPVGPGTRVADGSTLYVEVGGSGSPIGVSAPGAGGFNGGGAGGAGNFLSGGGGAGATDLRIRSRVTCPLTGVPATDPRLLVAGGNGGPGPGGPAGGLAGLPAPGQAGTSVGFAVSGSGASGSAGAPAGPALRVPDRMARRASRARAARVVGSVAAQVTSGGGGGGGGGFYGGGGGGANSDGNGAGGGGGTSYAEPAATQVTYGSAAGSTGQLTITYQSRCLPHLPLPHRRRLRLLRR